MKRPDPSQVSKKGAWSCPDPWFSKTYPSLAQGMCDIWWDDGKPRVPYTLTVRADSDGVHLCLNDKEMNAGSYTTAGTLQEALSLVDAALKAGTLSWRRWKK